MFSYTSPMSEHAWADAGGGGGSVNGCRTGIKRTSGSYGNLQTDISMKTKSETAQILFGPCPFSHYYTLTTNYFL